MDQIDNSTNQVDNLVEFYNNIKWLNPIEKCEKKLIELYGILSNMLASDVLLPVWHIRETSWFIPHIYRKNIILNNNNKGFYIQERPDTANLKKLLESLDIKTELNELIKLDDNLGLCISNAAAIKSIETAAIKSIFNSMRGASLRHHEIRRQNKLLCNIAHSTRTPLNGILHITDTLLMSNPIDEIEGIISRKNSCLGSRIGSRMSVATPYTDKENLTILSQSALNLAHNLFDVIDTGLLDLDKLKIDKTVVNIKSLINQIVTLQDYQKPHVTFAWHIDKGVPEYIYTDHNRLKQILVNLIENAYHTTNTGEINLYIMAIIVESSVFNKTDANQYMISFNISDTGHGIDSKTVSELFLPPEIIYSNHKGIGLRVSYLLAKKLGGNLRLKSTKIGKGSCFELTLIACEEKPPSDTQEAKTLEGKSILLIDSSNNYHGDKIVLCKTILDCGMNYTQASSYNEVAILHAEKEFDAVICIVDEYSQSIVSRLRVLYENSLFLGIIPSATSYKGDVKGMFHKTISIPADEEIYKNAMSDIFESIYDTNNRADLCILAVDDDSINRIVIDKLLRNKGYMKIDLASDGLEALNMVKNNVGYYDVLLIDLRMPVMGGYELSEKVAELYAASKELCPKMIGVTAQTILEDDPKAHLKTFVFKPISIDDLDKKILE